MPDATPRAPAHAFARTVAVRPADLDDNRHVNNVVYVQWVQEVAVAHWEALASPALRAQLGWVCMRHEIDYLHGAVLGDEVRLHTWVGEASGLTFERHVEIARVADGRLLARSRTLWCPVELATGRPRRVPAEVRSLVSVASGTNPP